MGACWEAIWLNDRRMLINEILQEKTFSFSVRKVIRNVFSDTQDGLEFQTLSKLYFIDYMVTDNKKNVCLRCWNYVKTFVS